MHIGMEKLSKMDSMDLDGSFHSLVDQEEVNFRVIEKLNKIFGDDVRNLSKAKKLLSELEETKNELEKRLRFATTEAPDKISKAVREAEGSLGKSESLSLECDDLQREATEHAKQKEDLLQGVAPGVQNVQRLQQRAAYLQWVAAVEEASEQVETSLNVAAVGQAVIGYRSLVDIAEVVKDSRCEHLKTFVNETLLYWYHVLKENFSKEFEKVLVSLKWPFVSTAPEELPATGESVQRLQSLTNHLLQLRLPQSVSSCSDGGKGIGESAGSLAPGIIADFASLSLPMQLLLKPLKMRFVYHFSGNKVTNSRENPEWFLTRVLSWVSSHTPFLSKHVQPVYDRAGMQNVSAKVELMLGLIRLVMLKLASDLPEVQYDDEIFCKTIQETLNFERELSEAHSYPSWQPSVLGVLTQAPFLTRWLAIERKYAQERMDELVGAEGAWQAGDGEEGAQCEEQLILLVQGITHRYQRLPQPGHRLQFVQLQVEVLEEFHMRLVQLMSGLAQTPLHPTAVAMLNTAYHIHTTLSDWADLPFFIEMQYYKAQQSRLLEQEDLPVLGSLQQSSLTPLSTTGLMDEELPGVEGCVFDAVLQLYEHVTQDMLKKLTHFVTIEVRAKSQPYRKDKWFCMPVSHGGVQEVSSSACPLLEVLARHLAALRSRLDPHLFTNLWHQLAQSLNRFVYEEVILVNNFNEGGAAQLQFDMTRGLFPIFGEFTQRPENFFKDIKESCILLTLLTPVAMLLQETLKAALRGEESVAGSSSPVKALMEHGVSTLGPHQALTILNIRTNMTHS